MARRHSLSERVMGPSNGAKQCNTAKGSAKIARARDWQNFCRFSRLPNEPRCCYLRSRSRKHNHLHPTVYQSLCPPIMHIILEVKFAHHFTLMHVHRVHDASPVDPLTLRHPQSRIARNMEPSLQKPSMTNNPSETRPCPCIRPRNRISPK